MGEQMVLYLYICMKQSKQRGDVCSMKAVLAEASAGDHWGTHEFGSPIPNAKNLCQLTMERHWRWLNACKWFHDVDVGQGRNVSFNRWFLIIHMCEQDRRGWYVTLLENPEWVPAATMTVKGNLQSLHRSCLSPKCTKGIRQKVEGVASDELDWLYCS